MIGETQNKHLLSNLGSKNYDSNKLNQMPYKQDLTNNIFDHQSHYKTTAAFLVNKLFFYYNKFDLNIHKAYTYFLRKKLHTFAFLYFDVKPVSQNSEETIYARASFLLKLLKKRLQHSGFPVNFANLKEYFFIEQLWATAYVGHGMRF